MNSPKKIFGFGVKILIALVVLAFLGLQSLNFFSFVFPSDQWYYAYLGFGLTSVGVVAYLIIFMTDADTALRKTIAITMMIVCVVGEVLTAGFGMQVEAWKNSGFQLAQEDYSFMILAVQVLGFAHALAMIVYFAGDEIVKAFRDDDGDGVPNIIDPDYREWKRQQAKRSGQQPQNKPAPLPVPVNTNAAETQKVDLDTRPTDRQSHEK